MNLEKIISISGKPGLYQLISQAKGGFIAQNLLNGKKTSIPATYNVSLLSNVAIYTVNDEVPLEEVFEKIADKENKGKAISHKASEKELRNYMSEVLPDYDATRVYKSDLKKLFQWYNILADQGLLESEEEQEIKSENDISEEE